jgi:hypothetical protein
MTTNNSELQIKARRILDAIAFTLFEQCQPLSREFANIPARPGIYAIRHKTDGLLDKYSDEEVRIAMQLISYWENPALLLELEAIILRATEPPYNVQIPAER